MLLIIIIIVVDRGQPTTCFQIPTDPSTNALHIMSGGRIRTRSVEPIVLYVLPTGAIKLLF